VETVGTASNCSSCEWGVWAEVYGVS